MRKLKLQAHITIDGFVAGSNGEMDWSFLAGPDELGFQKIIGLAETADTILFGRKMAEGLFLNHWDSLAVNPTDNSQKTFGKLIAGMRRIAFSRSEKPINARNVELQNGDLGTVVNDLKNQPGKDMIVYGGGEFVRSLISLNLIDEYYFIVNPVVIGAGLSIFKEQKILTLESSMVFNNGKLLNKYRPA